jgi:threonine/homoserine/homoserine lactone efflux protein
MTFSTWLAFAAASAILLVIPGPTILTVISYSLAHGKKVRLPLAVAVALGDSTALVLSILGLGALLAVSAFWFGVVKWIGGGYLVYLGVKMLRAGACGGPALLPKAPASVARLFANTWLVTALNPKGMVFFAAFLPQFINPEVPTAPQLWVLSATFVVMAFVNAGAYALFASQARRIITGPRALRAFHLSGGALLTGAGVWALLSRRAA